MGKYYIGLDGGSTYLKAALIGNNQVIDTMVRDTGIDNDGTARKLVHELCENNGISPSDIDVFVADYPQFNGAIGAALIASERG